MEWGSEIEVNGVRPEWLRDDEHIAWIGKRGDSHELINDMNCGDLFWDNNVRAIRLPADHSYYTATEKGFTYWPGGDGYKGPSDYDGGEVMLRSGTVESVAPAAYSYDENHYLTAFWRNDSSTEDIIDYHPRTESTWQPDSATIAYVTDKLREAGHADVAELILPTPVDPDVLAVREILAAACVRVDDWIFANALAAYRKHRP